MKINPTQKNTGFTLIELLVVVAIIGLLSSIVLSSLSIAREKAQDSKVVQEVHSAQLAIQLFVSSNGKLPVPDERNDYYCLNATGGCQYRGAPVNPPNPGGWFSLSEPNKTFVNKVYAYLDDTLPSLSLNPSVIATGGEFIGPMYYCDEDGDSDCSEAKIIFTVNSTSCPGSSSLHIAGSTGSVCESPADGGAGGTSPY